MQQIGSLARRILADCKRAKEARDKLRLAGGLLGLAEFTNQPTLSRVSAESGDQNPNASKGFAALKDSGRQSTPDREDAGDLEKSGHAAEKRKSTSNDCACPNPETAIGADRAKVPTLRGLE